MNHPYSAPQADLETEQISLQTYEPKLFTIHGRIGRLRFLGFNCLFSLLVFVIFCAAFLRMISGLQQNGLAGMMGLGLLVTFVSLPATVINLLLAKRRLNDLNQNGWLSLLLLVPIVNLFMSLYLLFAPGSTGVNTYGPAPSKNPVWVVLAAFGIPIVMMVGAIMVVARVMPEIQDYNERMRNISQPNNPPQAGAPEEAVPAEASTPAPEAPAPQEPATPAGEPVPPATEPAPTPQPKEL